jgi:hypothetical protein
MGRREWLTVPEFALLADVSRQSAHEAVSRCARGKLWKGSALRVRTVDGARGGRSGVRYEVALSSLSDELQNAFNGVSDFSDLPAPAVGCGYVPADHQGDTIAYRWRVIEEAVAEPPRSATRKAEVLRASKKWREPERTIYRWIKRLEGSGGDVNALARKRPADAGSRRVWIARGVDRAFRSQGFGDELLSELAGRIDQLTRAAWASPAQRAGWKQVRREVVTAINRELRERGIGIAIGDDDVSERRIKTFDEFRVVDLRAHDRKRYDDMKPRIRRNNALFLPMEQVLMDVKPLDNVVLRPDGSRWKPRMIAFQDSGTQRLFRHFVLSPAGEGIRQEHVVEAFLDMVAHPEWGFPLQLYRDNGTEFYVLDMVRDCLKALNHPGARTIINAKPYSGASKPIESKFAQLDRFVFSQMGGYTGGTIGQAKTQTVGRPTKPYGGSFEAFVREAEDRIAVFEHQPLESGPMKGYSPMSKLAERVAEGWRPVMVDTLAIDAAFCKTDTRRVDRGAVSIDGVRYRHPELPNGRTVSIALPWRRGGVPIVKLPDLGWAALEADMPYLPTDISGAVASGRMQQGNDRRTRQLRRTAGTIDRDANLRDRLATLPTRAAPAPLMDILASEDARAIGAAREAGEVARLAAPDRAARDRARRMEETEALERYLASKRA